MPDTPNTAEPGKPRRRWFQFRLRTLLVGVVLLAALCAYIGREVRIAKAREKYMQRERWLVSKFQIDVGGPFAQARPLPLIRRLCGDQWHQWVIATNAHEYEEARALFPEALVVMDELNVAAPHGESTQK